VSEPDVLAANPDLQPELERELGLLRLIERARSSSRSRSASGAAAAATVPPLPDGLEAYHVIREIHRGGQGVVYEAIQRSTGRRVAVKVRRESFFGDRRDTERFQREVEILAQLEHPGIVGVIDSGVFDGTVYYVMDYVEGQPIDEYLAGRSLEVRDVLRLFEKIAAAVNAAHLRGVIHRDLKPANILIDATGEPHLLDFGLARLTAELADAARAGRTMTGQFVGSLPWASPEQAEGVPSKIDLRTDVYSLGIVLFQMLTGRMPYRVDDSHAGEGLRGAISVIMNALPPRPSTLRRGIDADVDTIVLKCLSKERQRRYQSAAELAEDVRRYLADRPIAARPPSVRYQLARFARRNRAVVVAAAAVAMALAAGAISTVVQLARARQAETLAELRRVDAEKQSYIANIYAADAAIRSNDGPAARSRLSAAPEPLRAWEWRYLQRQTDRSSRTLEATSPVIALTRTGDDGVIGIGDDGGLRRWRLSDGAIQWTAKAIVPAIKPLSSIRASADGARVLVVNPTQAAVYDAGNGQELRRWDLGTRPTLICGVLTGDGHAALVAGRAGFGLHRLDVETGEDRLLNDDFIADVRDLDLSRDGTLLASVENPRVVIRDAATGAILRTASNSAPEFSGEGRIRFSPDGALIAVTLASTIRLFDSATLRAGPGGGELRGHPLFVRAIEFSPDGQSLASCADDASVRVWSVAAREGASTLLGHDTPVYSLCWDSRGEGLISTATDERGPRVWRLAEARAARSAPVNAGEESLGLRGSDLLVLSADRTRILLRKLDGSGADAELLRFPPLTDGTLSLAGNYGLCATGGHELRLLDLGAGTSRIVATLPPDNRAPTSFPLYFTGVSADGRFASWNLSRRDELHVIDTASGAEVFVTGGAGRRLSHSAFTDDGRRLLCAIDGEIVAFDTGDWHEVCRVKHLPFPLSGVSASPDGRNGTVADLEGGVAIFDIETGEVRSVHRVAAGPLLMALFTPDGRRIAAGGEDRAIRIIDPSDGTTLLTLRGHASLITKMAWNDDGARLFTVSHDGEARIWDAGAKPSPQGQPVK
jgi:WD40 repeat protein/tRNA A-37 threonylcarbamoyl transferase component Bud32